MGADISEAFIDKDANSIIFRGDICGPITESMNESMFQLVILKWRNAFDGLKETHDYKFLSAAGSLMKTMVIFPPSTQKFTSFVSLTNICLCSLLIYG